MSLRKAILPIIGAVGLLLSLTGCNGSSNTPSVTYTETPSATVYVDTSTGKITKYVDSFYGDLFEEGFSSKDKKVNEVDHPALSYDRNIGSHTLTSIVEVDGVPYPVNSTLKWAVEPYSDASVTIYNKYVAESYKDTVANLEWSSVWMLAQEYINEQMYDALNGNQFPAPEVTTTGRTLVEGDAKIIDAWRSGKPAWQAQQELFGSVSGETYFYSFFCSSHTLSMNSDALMESLVPSDEEDANLVGFSVTLDKETIYVETEEPCGIEFFSPRSDKFNSNEQPPPLPSEG